MTPNSIDPDMPVDEIMRRWPATIRVMIRYRMLCVGCPIAIFHTVADACAAHGVDVDAFCAELLEVMQDSADPAKCSAFRIAADQGSPPA